MDHNDDAGVTLVEIVVAVVVLGAVLGALLVALTTSALNAKRHRDLVTADHVLRSYAESTKDAVRNGCVGGALNYSVSYLPPPNFTVTPAPGTSTACPTPDTTASVDIVTTGPDVNRSLTIAVRTP